MTIVTQIWIRLSWVMAKLSVAFGVVNWRIQIARFIIWNVSMFSYSFGLIRPCVWNTLDILMNDENDSATGGIFDSQRQIEMFELCFFFFFWFHCQSKTIFDFLFTISSMMVKIHLIFPINTAICICNSSITLCRWGNNVWWLRDISNQTMRGARDSKRKIEIMNDWELKTNSFQLYTLYIFCCSMLKVRKVSTWKITELGQHWSRHWWALIYHFPKALAPGILEKSGTPGIFEKSSTPGMDGIGWKRRENSWSDLIDVKVICWKNSLDLTQRRPLVIFKLNSSNFINV